MNPLTDRQIHNCATRRLGNNVHHRQVRDRNMFPQLDFAYQFALLRQRRNAIMDGIKESDVANVTEAKQTHHENIFAWQIPSA